MQGVVRLALVDPNDASRASLKNMLLGIDTLWLEAECSRYEFFNDVVMQTEPDIALVAIDGDPEKGLNLVAAIRRTHPSCSILVVSSSQEGSLILQAMRNGAKEFLQYPLQLEDFLSALDRIRAADMSAPGEGGQRATKVITVAGTSGGVGCTSLGINLGCAIANADDTNTVVIIDLDMTLGDADVWLDIIPDYTIQDVAENISRLDFSLLKRSLTRHECGAFLLPRPIHLEGTTPITTEQLKRVISLLKATFTHVIIDLSKSFGALDMVAIDLSDMVLLVTQLDLPCLRNVVRLMQFFDEQEIESEKVKVIVNRIGLEDSQISLNKALDTIGREIYTKIPNDYVTMVESRNNGVPLIMQSQRAKLTRSIQELATMIDANDDVSLTSDETSETTETKSKSKSMFSFLSSSK